MGIVRAAIDAADAGRLVERALSQSDVVAPLEQARAIDVLSVGKAASPMRTAFASACAVPIRTWTAIGPSEAGHPIPDERSVAAARRALAIATGAGQDDVLVVLLSGGASSLMALPAGELSLADKQWTVAALLSAGADITELNTVRKHLSAIKGGRLAAACRGATLTLAVSDVVGDDLSVIGSGPTAPDESTWSMALDVLDRCGGRACYPERVIDLLHRGATGELPDTPTANDPRLARSRACVIGGRVTALDGARKAAESAGYHVHVIEEPVVGEARVTARVHLATLRRLVSAMPRPLCVLSAGETTVRVTGRGKGGRNQEFALTMAPLLGGLTGLPAEAGSYEAWSYGTHVVVASIGTDGIDGPTDAAGAIVDTTTMARALHAGLGAPAHYLEDNNSYAFFETLGDLVRTGPTNTNVGDLQVVLIVD